MKTETKEYAICHIEIKLNFCTRIIAFKHFRCSNYEEETCGASRYSIPEKNWWYSKWNYVLPVSDSGMIPQDLSHIIR